MDRTSATAYLTEEFRELVTEAQFIDAQTASAYTVAVDMSLRHLGVAETDLATYVVGQAQVLAYLALLRYYALKRFATALAPRVAVNLPGPVAAQRQQAFSQVQTLLAMAEDDLAKLGVELGSSTWQIGRLELDFQEPGYQGEFGVPMYGWGWW